MDRWKSLRCWLSVLSPCSPSSSPRDSGESYLVGRRLHGRPRGVSGRLQSCLHGSCGGGSIRSRGGGRSPGFISRHHSTNLRRNRILISSSGSGGPGTPNLNLSASLLFALLPSPSGQRERRDAGQGCEGGGGGGPISAPVGVPGAFPFVLLVEVIPSLLPFAGVIRAIGSLLRAFLGQPFHRFPETADLSLQKAHLPPQVCAVLFLLTVGRSRALHCRLFVYRSGLRPIASRNVAAVGTAAGSSGVGGHSSGLCVGIGVGVRPDSSAESESPRTRLPTACGVPCLRRDRWQRRGCL